MRESSLEYLHVALIRFTRVCSGSERPRIQVFCQCLVQQSRSKYCVTFGKSDAPSNRDEGSGGLSRAWLSDFSRPNRGEEFFPWHSVQDCPGCHEPRLVAFHNSHHTLVTFCFSLLSVGDHYDTTISMELDDTGEVGAGVRSPRRFWRRSCASTVRSQSFMVQGGVSVCFVRLLYSSKLWDSKHSSAPTAPRPYLQTASL